MIPFPLQAGQLGFEGGNSTVVTPPSYIGITTTTDLTTASISLSVPGAAVDGDLLLCILRCRTDRTITIPGTFTTHEARSIIAGTVGTTNHEMVYIVSKARAGETSLSFTQSVSAACSGMMLVFRDGSVGAKSLTDGTSSSITKASGNTLLLAIGLNADDGIANNVTTPGNPAFSGYTQRGYSKWSTGGGAHFYGIVAETLAGSAAGSKTASMTWAGPSDQRAVWIAEIG